MAQEGPDTGDLTLDSFLQDTYESHEQTQREMEEIGLLVKQSSAEVDRLAQRNTRVANYLSHLQTNFDTVPREDIKEGYEALINAQQRLFTMRGQLEKLQSDQRHLERLSTLQRRLLAVTAGLGDIPALPVTGHDPANIVRVVQSEESARQVLVRRMHDGPASSLSNFILQAEICERFFDLDPGRAREELQALKKSATATFAAVKGFIFDLRPMMLDDLGVIPTLRRYVESLEDKFNIGVALTVTGQVRRLEEHIELTIFRSVQELLNNARIHGQATDTEVIVDMDDELVSVVVDDNGLGFNVDDSLADVVTPSTIGLPTLRDRIEMLGGEFNIQSSLGQGTRANFTIPVLSGSELSIQ